MSMYYHRFPLGLVSERVVYWGEDGGCSGGEVTVTVVRLTY